MFEPFFTTKHRGTGLGLSTANRLVEQHRGEMRAECPPGGGTIVTVSLPAGRTRETALADTVAPSATPAAPASASGPS
jgi:signal transduction histidine kinase